jgi:2-phosphoglycerate kinase
MMHVISLSIRKEIKEITEALEELLSQHTMRTKPNIIVTGTPGVGKTTHCETLAQNTGLKHLPINDIVKERGCHDGYDEEFKSWIVDEDKVSAFIAFGV